MFVWLWARYCGKHRSQKTWYVALGSFKVTA